MIRVSGEQLLGAVDLLGQHRPGEQVGPGHGAEGQHQRSFLQQRLTVAVGAADQEGDVCNTIVTPAAEAPAKPAKAARRKRA